MTVIMLHSTSMTVNNVFLTTTFSVEVRSTVSCKNSSYLSMVVVAAITT